MLSLIPDTLDIEFNTMSQQNKTFAVFSNNDDFYLKFPDNVNVVENAQQQQQPQQQRQGETIARIPAAEALNPTGLKKRRYSELSLDISKLFDPESVAAASKQLKEQKEGTVGVVQDIASFQRNMQENFNARTPITRWTEHEEVILQGVVIDCNLIYGTQASWKQICHCYTIATRNFAAVNKLGHIRKRTSCALKKHYRVMHNRIRDGEVCTDFWYQVYHVCWMSEAFNKSKRLIDYSNL